MFHELEVMNYGSGDWEKMAISDVNFHHVRDVDANTCRVYDHDDICLYTVRMPYKELVARLNGAEIPKKPEPVEIEAWAVISFDGKFFRPFRTKGEATACWDKLLHNDEYDVIPMKGSYIPWR